MNQAFSLFFGVGRGFLFFSFSSSSSSSPSSVVPQSDSCLDRRMYAPVLLPLYTLIFQPLNPKTFSYSMLFNHLIEDFSSSFSGFVKVSCLPIFISSDLTNCSAELLFFFLVYYINGTIFGYT
jgi:hypothetical protein